MYGYNQDFQKTSYPTPSCQYFLFTKRPSEPWKTSTAITTANSISRTNFSKRTGQTKYFTFTTSAIWSCKPISTFADHFSFSKLIMFTFTITISVARIKSSTWTFIFVTFAAFTIDFRVNPVPTSASLIWLIITFARTVRIFTDLFFLFAGVSCKFRLAKAFTTREVTTKIAQW